MHKNPGCGHTSSEFHAPMRSPYTSSEFMDSPYAFHDHMTQTSMGFTPGHAMLKSVNLSSDTGTANYAAHILNALIAYYGVDLATKMLSESKYGKDLLSAAKNSASGYFN